jgi:hypothetical protein
LLKIVAIQLCHTCPLLLTMLLLKRYWKLPSMCLCFARGRANGCSCPCPCFFGLVIAHAKPSRFQYYSYIRTCLAIAIWTKCQSHCSSTPLIDGYCMVVWLQLQSCTVSSQTVWKIKACSNPSLCRQPLSSRLKHRRTWVQVALLYSSSGGPFLLCKPACSLLEFYAI